MDPSIFKAYDIRGVYPTEINEGNIVAIAEAIYAFFDKTLKSGALRILIGRDMRTSSNPLFDVVAATLRDRGATVVDMGLTSTPTFYFGALKYDFDAGIMITASHNPKEYNGLKLVIKVGNTLRKIGGDSGMYEIRDKAIKGAAVTPIAGGGLEKISTVQKDEVTHALSIVSPDSTCTLRVVTDTANGMAITYLNEMFSRFPKMQIIRMNEKLDGTFPAHEANPLKFETLKDLQKRVIAERADFGIAPDADGDRIFFIDEKGGIIPATMITCLIADEVLKKKPGAAIVVDIRYIKNVQNLVKSRGGTTSLTKVGHAFISNHMKKVGAEFAGESSGHFFFKATGYAESSVLILAHVLNVVCREKKPLSEIVKKYHTAYESGEYNFEIPTGKKSADLLESVKKNHANLTFSTLDGLSGDGVGWRLSIRTSNTEPLLRLNVEADDKSLMEEKVSGLRGEFEAFGAVPK